MADLEKYRNGFQEVVSLINSVPEELLDYIPKHKDAWSIKEHIIHLVDSETNGFIRLKSIIAQPGSDCYVMDEENWTMNIRRKHEDIHKYLQLFKNIRELSYDFIYDEPIESWDKQFFLRTYQGKTVKITIENWIELYINHLVFHEEYIRKIIDNEK